MIRVLVVDDSPSICEYLCALFASDPEFQVVGAARNGSETVPLVERLKPDVISMDLTMPGIDGFETTRQIMSSHPTPIVIVSARCDRKSAALSFQVLEAGALSLLGTPAPLGSPGYEASRRELLDTFRAMAGVRVIRRSVRPVLQSLPKVSAPSSGVSLPSLIVIGASTGGPPVLHTIISRLPATLPVPIVVVQHITHGFIDGLVDWLGSVTTLPVSTAKDLEIPLPGHVYLAPDGVHLELSRDRRLRLVPGSKEFGVCPAVSRLFRSVTGSYGRTAIGVLLSGMGRDGAEEMLALRRSGGITIAQDAATSVVHGMPGEAIRLGAAIYISPDIGIASLLCSLTGQACR